MPTIQELNQRRCELQQRVHHMGMMNMPTDPVAQLQADAAYRLVRDAWIKAESDYNDALVKMSAEDLLALVDGPAETQ